MVRNEPGDVRIGKFDILATYTYAKALLDGLPEGEAKEKGLVAAMAVHLELGDPAPNGGIDREHLTLRLRFGDRVLTSRGRSGWFEDELADLRRQMPEGTYLKACINCTFSDYSPSGHGLFGGLACFRDNKASYREVRTRRDLFGIWGTMTEFVQETFLCPEFERRSPGTGYRG